MLEDLEPALVVTTRETPPWATTTVGSQFTFDPAWSGLVSFTAQVGQQRATVYGGLLGLSYTFAQAPSLPIVVKN